MMHNNDRKLKRKNFALFLAMQWLLVYSSSSILIIAPKLIREESQSTKKIKSSTEKI